MRKWLKRIALALLLIIGVGAAWGYAPDTDETAMQAEYGGPTSRRIDTAQGRIHYQDSGPPSQGGANAPVLLLIHGSNGHLQTWDGVRDRLKHRYRIIALDLPGHGLTGAHPNRDYSADQMIAAGTAALDDAKVQSAVWVGNSMGGWVAWRAALSVPDRVSATVLVDASGVPEGTPGIPSIKPYLGARVARSAVGGEVIQYIMPRGMIASSLAANYAREERISDALVTRYWELLRYPGNRRATADRANTPREPEKWREIGRISQPVLLIWGKHDKVIPLAHADAFKAALPQAELSVIADAGHLPMEETPASFSATLDGWLAKQILTNQSASQAR